MTEKRTNLNDCFSTSHILLQLENICFIRNVEEDIFVPYVMKHLPDFLSKQWSNESLQSDLKTFREEIKSLDENAFNSFFAELKDEDTDKNNIIKCVNWQLENKKVTDGLKNLQQIICEEGFKTGNLKLKLNNYVESCIKSWADDGRSIHTFSCYPIAQQKLMLSNTEQGDMVSYFENIFDEEVGPKTEKNTYIKIVEKLGCESCDVMFITNNSEYAAASSASNLITLLIVQDSVQQEEAAKFSVNVIHSLTDIEFTVNAKKRKISKETIEIPENKPEQQANQGNQSDVEMIDVSENKINVDEEKHAVEAGQGDFRPREGKSEIITGEKHLGGGDCVDTIVDKSADKVAENNESSGTENAVESINDKEPLTDVKEDELANQNEIKEKKTAEDIVKNEVKTENVEKDVNDVSPNVNDMQPENIANEQEIEKKNEDISSNVKSDFKGNGIVNNLKKEEEKIDKEDLCSDETNGLKTDKLANKVEKASKELNSNVSHDLKTEKVSDLEKDDGNLSAAKSNEAESKQLAHAVEDVKTSNEDATFNQDKRDDKKEITSTNEDLKSSDSVENESLSSNNQPESVNESIQDQLQVENTETSKDKKEENLDNGHTNGVEEKEGNKVTENGECNGAKNGLKNHETEQINKTEAQNGNCDKTDTEPVKTELNKSLNSKIENGKTETNTNETKVKNMNDENLMIEEKKLLEKSEVAKDLPVDEVKS